MLSAPFRSRFGVNFRLDFYNQDDIEKIVSRSARLLAIGIESNAVKEVALASRFTPRVANRLLKRVRDFGQMNPVKGRTSAEGGSSADHAVKAGRTSNGMNDPYITAEIAKQALKMLEIDDKGLEETDRKILLTIANIFDGGPVGLKSIAASISEEEGTIEEVYEPYLMQMGFLARTPKGRVVTSKGFEHLGLKNKKPKLF
jgi:Holliday junction DNA helicase RuvB